VRIRHVENPRLAMTTTVHSGHKGAILGLCTTGARGQLVVSAGMDGRVKIFDPRSSKGLGEPVCSVKDIHSAERVAHTCVLGPRGEGEGGGLRLTPMTPTPQVSSGYHPARSVCATMGSSDYSTIVVADGGPGGSLHVFDTRRPMGLNDDPAVHGYGRCDPRWRPGTLAPKGNAVAVLSGHTSLARCCAMSHDGTVVVTGSDDKTVKKKNCIGIPRKERGLVFATCFAAPPFLNIFFSLIESPWPSLHRR